MPDGKQMSGYAGLGRKMAIAALINGLICGAGAALGALGSDRIPFWGAGGILFTLFPSMFMVTFMTCFVDTLRLGRKPAAAARRAFSWALPVLVILPATVGAILALLGIADLGARDFILFNLVLGLFLGVAVAGFANAPVRPTNA